MNSRELDEVDITIEFNQQQGQTNNDEANTDDDDKVEDENENNSSDDDELNDAINDKLSQKLLNDIGVIGGTMLVLTLIMNLKLRDPEIGNSRLK